MSKIRKSFYYKFANYKTIYIFALNKRSYDSNEYHKNDCKSWEWFSKQEDYGVKWKLIQYTINPLK